MARRLSPSHRRVCGSSKSLILVSDHSLTRQQMNSSLSVSIGAIHLYKLGYLYGFFSSFVLYSALSIAFPPKLTFAYGSEVEETAVSDKA